MDIHYSSQDTNWSTPEDFFRMLDHEFHFTLDPCATTENAKCKKFYTKATNGLFASWAGEIVFMNPPYGREIAKWVKKAYIEATQGGATVVCLIPSRTDTRWWHDYIMKANEIRYIKGRLKFGESKNSAPFPSAVAIFRPQFMPNYSLHHNTKEYVMS